MAVSKPETVRTVVKFDREREFTTGFRIITADERLRERRGVKAVLLGISGIGKTTLLWTLPSGETLFLDLEAGDLAVEGWPGDTVRPRTWAECRDFAVFIGGANPALRDDQPYSQAHYDAVCERFGDPAVLDRYETIFVELDHRCRTAVLPVVQGAARGDLRENRPAGRPEHLHGLHGREMIGWPSTGRQARHPRCRRWWSISTPATSPPSSTISCGIWASRR